MVAQCKRYVQVDTGAEAVVLSLYQDAHALLVSAVPYALLVSAVPALPCRFCRHDAGQISTRVLM